MIFLERPITTQHIRDVCARFNEGLRVEYKVAFDGSVRSQLPKIVSSFANSQGGVLVVGVRAVNGVPQAPIEGFEPSPREELPLTVENICLQSINPPVLPRIQVVQSDKPNHVFLVIEVEESAEAPHAIENSTRVYVRTGNAANPYELAEVDLIIDLLRRRSEPLERRDRMLKAAQDRSVQTVPGGLPYLQVSICPQFPRTAICSSEEAWEFLVQATYQPAALIPANSTKRVPDGVASLSYQNAPRGILPRYAELNKYGLLYATSPFSTLRTDPGAPEQLDFASLFQILLRAVATADRFYEVHGYQGNLLILVSLHGVQSRMMRFVPAGFMDDQSLEDFRCFAKSVAAERLVGVHEIRVRRADTLTAILSEITWAFWQSYRDYPLAQLQTQVRRGI